MMQNNTMQPQQQQQPQGQQQPQQKQQKPQQPSSPLAAALGKTAGIDPQSGQPQSLGQMSYLAIQDAVKKGWIKNGEDLHQFILKHPTASRAATQALSSILGLHIFQ